MYSFNSRATATRFRSDGGVEVVEIRHVPARKEDAVPSRPWLDLVQDPDGARAFRHDRQTRAGAFYRLAHQAAAAQPNVGPPGLATPLDQRAHFREDAVGGAGRAAPVIEDAAADLVGRPAH
ncbi:MAG: hypothetical protein DMD98_20340 [Candidatus Rokuibacteriota bacterium]|nr:MAG: hypothetical protein DMD98_20340 [Candidatus Rokubacteria bacterium]